MSQTLSAQELALTLNFPTPTPEQAAVIENDLSPLLVVAGAGSGKTATMSQRIVYLVATGQVRPDQVLGLTFTRKATGELHARVRSQLLQLVRAGITDLSEDFAEPTIATYNSFGASLVRDFGLHIGVDPDVTLMTEARALQLAQELIESVTYPLPEGAVSRIAASIMVLDGALSENMLSLEQAEAQITALHDFFDEVATRYRLKTAVGRIPARLQTMRDTLPLVADFRVLKHEQGLMTFSDQIALASRIVTEVPQARHQMRERYPAVLLDEFQDTSVAQIRLLSALFANSGVTAVGDPNQAIYGWRGASAGALDSFHEHFNSEGLARLIAGEDPARWAPVLPLSVAWRNDRTILHAANVTSSPLRHHVPGPGDAPVEHIPVAELRPRPTSDLEAGHVYGSFLMHPLQEAETIAQFMEERWSPSASMAVLCRTRAQMWPIARALDERGIPYEMVGLSGLLMIPEVNDVRSLITVAADPSRGDRMIRLLVTYGIEARDLSGLMRIARNLVAPTQPVPAEGTAQSDSAEPEERDTAMVAEALHAVVRSHAEHHGAFAQVVADFPHLSEHGLRLALRLGQAVERVRAGVDLPLADLVTLAEQALGLDMEIAARVGNPMGRHGLDEFRQTAHTFTQTMDEPSLASFLEWLDAAEEFEGGLDAPEIEPEPGAVQLLTAHASKGLEWDVVAVSGLTEEDFPAYDAKAQDDLTVRDRAWLTDTTQFPHPLRADADSLPPFTLADADIESVDKNEFKELLAEYEFALGRHLVMEERRLAYVAFTRARHDLLLTGSHLSKTSKRQRTPSRFLQELRRRELLIPYGPGFVEWDENAVNPLIEPDDRAWWPTAPHADDVDPSTLSVREQQWRERFYARAAAADAVNEAVKDYVKNPGRSLTSADPRIQQWVEDLDLLLAERDTIEREIPAVHIPSHLAATKLDDLRGDPYSFALSLRRPLPPEPQRAARLGTVFHDAVEQLLNQRRALFPLTQAGISDELTPADRRRVDGWLEVVDALPLLDGWEVDATETDRELTIGATTLRCRMDAVFTRTNPRDGAPEWLIVDWKTGQREVPVDQLSIYVHAWAASQGVATDRVHAAYVYVAKNGLVRQLGESDLISLDLLARTLEIDNDPNLSL